VKFIIDGNTWHRGQGSQGSRLLRHDGNMCCLGHVGKQCGIDDTGLLGMTMPYKLWYTDANKFTEFLEPTSEGNRQILAQMANINDAQEMNDTDRMKELSALALSIGHEFKFINVGD
jgi:hypothetical protein